ncbi:MAG: hypothetical protein IT379_15480, partial [Deltaproteobacteria bacterium]|nr:hypothetical protein [Deltaproteobacteria bacterium]
DASGDSGGTEDDAGTPGGDSGDTDDDAGAPTDAGGACVVASDCPDDGDVCTSRRCDSGVCSYPPEPDGSSCGAASVCCAGICSGLEGAPFCGSCGTVCDANESCIAMVCTCDEPLQDCDALAGCESNRLTDPLNCGTCGMMCVSGACLGGTCAGGGDCVMPGDCMDDGLACTVNTCIANVCGHAAAPGACFIGGTCYTNGQRNPVDDCLECDPAMNQSGWSPSTGSCDDGQFCTVADACSGGICTGSPRDCDPPGMACLTGSCDESSDECGVTVTPGFCFIDAQCWPHLTPRPGFPCQHCLDTSPLEWSPRPDGSGCPALGDAGVGMCVSGMCT